MTFMIWGVSIVMTVTVKVAKPGLGRIRSTRQLTNRATRMMVRYCAAQATVGEWHSEQW